MRIGTVLKKWRLVSEVSLGDLAGSIGISTPTLYRLEAGRTPDGATLIKVLNWLCHEEKEGKK